MRSTERLYITDDGEVVHENDRRGRHLYAKLGDEIPDDVATKLGMKEPDVEIIAPPEVKRTSSKKSSTKKSSTKSSGGLKINKLGGEK